MARGHHRDRLPKIEKQTEEIKRRKDKKKFEKVEGER